MLVYDKNVFSSEREISSKREHGYEGTDKEVSEAYGWNSIR